MTRGKLRKLLLKMKQTMKKYKKEALISTKSTTTTPKNKNRQVYNLHKKTLKHYQMKGGGNVTIECKLHLKSQPTLSISQKQMVFNDAFTIGSIKKQISDKLTNRSMNIKLVDINNISVKSADSMTEYGRTSQLKTILQNSSLPHILNFYFPDSYKSFLSTHHTPRPVPVQESTQAPVQAHSSILESTQAPTPAPIEHIHPAEQQYGRDIHEQFNKMNKELVSELVQPNTQEQHLEPSSTSTVTVQSLIPTEVPAPNYELNPSVPVNNESIDQQLAPFQPHKDAPKEINETEGNNNDTMREMTIDEIISNFAKKVAAEVADRLKSNTDLQDSQDAVHEIMPQPVQIN